MHINLSPLDQATIEIDRLLDENIALQAKVAKYEARLNIDHCFVLGENHEMIRQEIPEDERGSFPDQVTCLEIEIAHLESVIKDIAPVIKISSQLLDFVMEKYKVENKEGLTCPIHRDLYDALEKLGKFDKDTE